MIKNVLLDLDDTLLDFHRAEAEAIRHTLSEVGIDPTDEMIKYVLRVADGEQTKNEINGYEEISIFKDGVTL